METILSQPAKILSQSQREAYFSDGFIGVENLVGEPWLSRLQDITAEFIDISRRIKGEDKRFDLEPNHNADEPRIRRLNSPADFHKIYWEFASQGPFVDVAEDLLGPNVKFHHSKLNFKWSGGGEEVRWHQDIQFWPHTNYQVLTLGVYLDDVTDDMSPMAVIPNSHNGPLYDLYDDSGKWAGALKDEDIDALDVASAVYLLNDLMDRKEDARHPTKRLRPIASGALSVRYAQVSMGGLIIASLTVGMLLHWSVAIVLSAYLLNNLAYTLHLKHLAYIDIACIALGFLLRVLAVCFSVANLLHNQSSVDIRTHVQR